MAVHDDRQHFEYLTLEAAQAGLSWLTVLKRREGYRKAFAKFDPAKVARFDRQRVDKLLTDPGIVRNRAKVESTVSNAAAFLELQEEQGSFDEYLWEFVDGTPVVNRWRSMDRVPATTPLSEAVSAESAAPGVPLRRPDGGLRPPPSGGARNRPRHGVFPPPSADRHRVVAATPVALRTRAGARE